MNNEIIKSGNDFEVRKPLSYQQYKDNLSNAAMSTELIEDFKNFHGLDLEFEVDKLLKKEYDLYLLRFDEGLE